MSKKICNILLPLKKKKVSRYRSDIIDGTGKTKFVGLFTKDAEEIIHAVNSHNSLVKENKELKEALGLACKEK